jgi:hypothetical protein
MDNLTSHTRKALVERFGLSAGDWLWNRFTVHFTPKARQLAEPSRDAIAKLQEPRWANLGQLSDLLKDKPKAPVELLYPNQTIQRPAL